MSCDSDSVLRSAQPDPTVQSEEHPYSGQRRGLTELSSLGKLEPLRRGRPRRFGAPNVLRRQSAAGGLLRALLPVEEKNVIPRLQQGRPLLRWSRCPYASSTWFAQPERMTERVRIETQPRLLRSRLCPCCLGAWPGHVSLALQEVPEHRFCLFSAEPHELVFQVLELLSRYSLQRPAPGLRFSLTICPVTGCEEASGDADQTSGAPRHKVSRGG